MTNNSPNFKLLSLLLLFIFGGTIVGETVSLSMVVGVAGSQILGKMYLINGLLLFLLPPLFFNNIDKYNRGNLLAKQLLISSIVLGGFLFIYKLSPSMIGGYQHTILLGIYPISYLIKITLFLTFWTLANDICFTREAKKEFPKIAAWGFVGALTGASVSRVLLEIIKPEMIISLWIISYLSAYLIVNRIIKNYKIRLLPKENIPKQKIEYRGFINDVKSVFSIKLVSLIAILYFLVFITIFLVDYSFWKICYQWFSNSKDLASFQFSFYLTHGIVTVVGLIIVTPVLINKYGFTRLFSYLPYTILIGAICVIILEITGQKGLPLFTGFIIFQFLRYVIFENTFSPIYQMFFAAISKKKKVPTATLR